jgi:putative ABC transport system substrate-binding protein
MKRRTFITLIGGAAVTRPLAAKAQQVIRTRLMPVVGFISTYSPVASTEAAFRHGLGEAGYTEGQNVKVEFHWTEGRDALLPEMAAELVRQQVSVIVAVTTPAVLAAKAAAATIPIVFQMAGDPVNLGLVASLNRPGGNITGVTQLASELVSKRVGLLHDLIPTASIMGFLVNPGACPDTRRFNTLYEITYSILLVFPDSMCLCKPNSIEPPWYGPVCPVVWELRLESALKSAVCDDGRGKA